MNTEQTKIFPKKLDKINKMIHNPLFWRWILVAIICIYGLKFLYSSYTPPFPPSWIGIKYYSFEVQEPVSLVNLEEIQNSLKTIQAAILVFEPTSEEAKRLIPNKLIFKTYTLTDRDVITFLLQKEIASEISGSSPQDKSSMDKILSAPMEALKLTNIVIAVTQSNNFDDKQDLLIEAIKAKGDEIPHEVYDKIQAELKIAPELKPADKITETNDAYVYTVKKRGFYRLYKNADTKNKKLSDTFLKPFDDYMIVNNSLIPIKEGKTGLLIFDKGNYQVPKGTIVTPITYYHALHTVNGLPFIQNGVGHGWTSISFEENGVFYPLMTASLFNSIDEDNSVNLEDGNITNIATYTNLWINHPDDWTRSQRSLNNIPLRDGPSRFRLNEITPEEAKRILLMRAWYLPQYSTQEVYMQYLISSFWATSNLKDKLTLTIEMGHIKVQNVMNQTFWGVIIAMVNGTWADVRYNGVTSNCVAYSTDFWNYSKRTPNYDPRMLRLVAVPGKLFQVMDPSDVVTLPDADSLPANQQDIPYLGIPSN